MIVCISDPKNFTRELLNLINIFSKVSQYKINSNKSVAFLYSKCSRGREGFGRERGGGGKKGGQFRYGRSWGRSREGQEFESKCVVVREGELGVSTRKSQMPGTQEVSRTQQGGL